ncbi:LruC domain-containing protein [Pedobacter metabolipauper]|uniref:LruC domain-containing protein n=1 Tax=Pedobacter metabolipauper TaxID=425513 RepID=A0A4V3D1Q5_9SPHI|nr:LruC domain-containing protein [Pedobacter metabolipauper]TDQ11993.1 LruC domain-containing protein [Pedobacter metabolipauper]
MNKNLLLITLSTAFLFLIGCKKEISGTEDPSKVAGEKVAPDGFAYQTTKKVDIDVRLLSRNDKPVTGVLVSLYDPANPIIGKEITKVMSDKNGYIRTSIVVPSSLDTIIIDPAYVGLIRNAKAYIQNNSLSAIIGGQQGFSGNIVIQKSVAESKKLSYVMSSGISSIGKNADNAAAYMYSTGDYDALGRPKNLEPVDNIDFSELMKQINHALPERQAVKEKYIATQVPSDLRIEKLADVWITFVHEGADYRNSFAYYTYPTAQKPTKPEDINDIHLIFPNASLKGAVGEGNMLQGDKVKIGRFPAGTSIGFVLLQDAYRGSGVINYGATKFFSTEGLNPETDNRLKRHNVVLNNVAQKTFLIGFEDINRMPNQGSDQDFNDLVVYAQSNPVEAISPVDVPFLDEDIVDTDSDGVPDYLDKYPKDPERAYDRYYPSEDVWGTTGFEDMWPLEGDYDLNDLVISYRYKFAMNSTNFVVDMTAEYKPLAAGAEFQNGFGVQLPILPGQIKNVTGMNISGNYIKLDSKGLESNQRNAVIIPFDNYRNLFGAGTGYINTRPNTAKIESDAVTLLLTFNSPIDDEFTASAPFNPFMISNLERGKEVHLVNHQPTDLANIKLLKSAADDSDAGSGRYYITRENRPFALDFFGPFNYPQESVSITDVYLHFSEWARSGGLKYPDWYENYNGYINTKLIYK